MMGDEASPELDSGGVSGAPSSVAVCRVLERSSRAGMVVTADLAATEGDAGEVDAAEDGQANAADTTR